MSAQPRRQKKCRACREWFRSVNSLQATCSLQCALTEAKKRSQREARQQLRKDRERIKPRSKWLSETQIVFNEFIRERDKHLPCISCGRFHDGQWHAGHYRTTKAAPELRFEELNTHKQCMPCNKHKSGDIVNFRINLIERIGEDKVLWLEGPHEPVKYTIPELKEIKRLYKQKTRELRAHA